MLIALQTNKFCNMCMGYTGWSKDAQKLLLHHNVPLLVVQGSTEKYPTYGLQQLPKQEWHSYALMSLLWQVFPLNNYNTVLIYEGVIYSQRNLIHSVFRCLLYTQQTFPLIRHFVCILCLWSMGILPLFIKVGIFGLLLQPDLFTNTAL